jgi:hypothetical protein
LVRNNNTCDFRPYTKDNKLLLSAILCAYSHGPIRRGILLDDAYQLVKNVSPPATSPDFNMHELNVIDDGQRALHLMDRSRYVDCSGLDIEGVEKGWVLDTGFREMDLSTGRTLFEWWPTDHISVEESYVEVRNLDVPYPFSWNFLHGNAVNKNDDGDYLFNGRFTDTIYKISGKDGRILWRLGGKNSDFAYHGFNWSRQHDAQWLHVSDSSETISFLDNASDPWNQTSTVSSALIVQLDKTSMTATLLQRIERPDGELSRLRGNFQSLPNGNFFVAWSDNAYISEHDAHGKLLMEARFQSERFVTYRSYKSLFVGRPAEAPVLKAVAFGAAEERSTTVCWVSWNGATEVRRWNFFSVDESGGPRLLGSVAKTGFETSFHGDGFQLRVFAEAEAADGSTVGKTEVFTTSRPEHWESTYTLDVGADSSNLLQTLQGVEVSWFAWLLVALAILSTCWIIVQRLRR